MKLEETVTSLEWSQKLKEAGFSQDTIFYWWKYPHKPKAKPIWRLRDKKPVKIQGFGYATEFCSAYTLAELLEALRLSSKNEFDVDVSTHGDMAEYSVTIWNKKPVALIETTNDNPANAAAEAALWLKENGYLK